MIRRLSAPLLAIFLAALIMGQPVARAQWVSGTPLQGTLTQFPTFIVGVSGTTITNIQVYSQALTPTITSAAIQTTEQTFTVNGLATTDKVYVNGPVPTSLCPPVTYRVSAANTLAIGFTTLTAVACTPAAGTYIVVAIRS